ncbi:MAG: DUF2809 domain-containing protein [Cyanobacteria bacterium J06597_1]
MKFQPYYWYWFLRLLFLEVAIALYVDDRFVRPYIGDVLVVISLYALIRAWFKYSIESTAVGVLIFSYCIEVLQYFNIVELLRLDAYPLARVIIGTSFSGKDFIAYTIGFLLILGLEGFQRGRNRHLRV